MIFLLTWLGNAQGSRLKTFWFAHGSMSNTVYRLEVASKLTKLILANNFKSDLADFGSLSKQSAKRGKP